VHRNFQLLASAVDRLGGVPQMLEAEDCLAEQVAPPPPTPFSFPLRDGDLIWFSWCLLPSVKICVRVSEVACIMKDSRNAQMDTYSSSSKDLALLQWIKCCVRLSFWLEQGPDTKVVVAYLAYLCARLLEVSQEERAAYTIQRLWKRWQARQPGPPPPPPPTHPPSK